MKSYLNVFFKKDDIKISNEIHIEQRADSYNTKKKLFFDQSINLVILTMKFCGNFKHTLNIKSLIISCERSLFQEIVNHKLFETVLSN